MERWMGVEEELLLVDPETGAPRSVAGRVIARGPAGSAALEGEIQSEQVETAIAPCRDAQTVGDELRRLRRAAVAAAERAGVAAAALATSPVATEPRVAADPRYERMVERYGLLAAEQLTCGAHVHVDVADLDEGAATLDRIGPWLPVLRALTGNSPYWQGADTGYASYRHAVWNRWPSAGPTGPFGDAAGYDAAVAAMLATDTLVDEGMVYFDARLSRELTTVEIRAADVCLRVDDAVLLAVLARALVATAAAGWAAGEPAPEVRAEVLPLAHWRAARSGLGDALVDPRTGRPAPAGQVLDALRGHVAAALEETGETELVRHGCARLLAEGTGADRQRRVGRDGDPRAVVADAVRVTAGG